MRYPIQTGLQQLLKDPEQFAGKHVGLATHVAAVLPDMTSAPATFLQAGIPVTALFSPEHGLDGSAAAGAKVGHAQHASGIPIFSLYGDTIRPSPAMLAQVDVLLFDMQDVGTRYYTYLSTMRELMLACNDAALSLIVLDRPNPLGGVLIEGPLIEAGFESFVGAISVPVRHGMTLGELALLIQSELCPQLDLTIVPMQGWYRTITFDQTALPWVPPSPNMAHLDAVALYPGTCLLEAVNVSCGRGTPLPFEICGAPWLHAEALAQHLNGLNLPGVRIRPMRFNPCADRYAGESCAGIQLHVTDLTTLRPVALGLHLLATLQQLHPEHIIWNDKHFDRLIGNNHLRPALIAGEDIASILAAWKQHCDTFAKKRQPFLLYK